MTVVGGSIEPGPGLHDGQRTKRTGEPGPGLAMFGQPTHLSATPRSQGRASQGPVPRWATTVPPGMRADLAFARLVPSHFGKVGVKRGLTAMVFEAARGEIIVETP